MVARRGGGKEGNVELLVWVNGAEQDLVGRFRPLSDAMLPLG